ncbi:MAG: flavin reductase family protein [Sphaerochaeta sp.]|nr:flavin reductase family protein [Sphaerochaeta sp.]
MRKKPVGAFIPLPVAPIVLVGAMVDGKPNFLPAAFVSGVNVDPPILCISLNKHHHTYRGICEHGVFSINIPRTGQVVPTDWCGMHSGRDTDKSAVFTTFTGTLENVPMIVDCPITCTCRCIGEHREFAMDTVVFALVEEVHVDENLLGADRTIDCLQADPLLFCGLENTYRSLGAVVGQGWKSGSDHTVLGPSNVRFV